MTVGNEPPRDSRVGVTLPDDEPPSAGPVDAGEAYITNPYPGRNLLTRAEAMNAINALSGMLLVDGIRRSATDSSEHQ